MIIKKYRSYWKYIWFCWVQSKSFAKTIHYNGGEQKASLSNVAEILSQCRIAFITFSTVLFEGGPLRWREAADGRERLVCLSIFMKLTSQLQLQFLSTNCKNCLIMILEAEIQIARINLERKVAFTFREVFISSIQVSF